MLKIGKLYQVQRRDNHALLRENPGSHFLRVPVVDCELGMLCCDIASAAWDFTDCASTAAGAAAEEEAPSYETVAMELRRAACRGLLSIMGGGVAPVRSQSCVAALLREAHDDAGASASCAQEMQSDLAGDDTAADGGTPPPGRERLKSPLRPVRGPCCHEMGGC